MAAVAVRRLRGQAALLREVRRKTLRQTGRRWVVERAAPESAPSIVRSDGYFCTLLLCWIIE
jgi:hypothetical protein